MNPMAALLMLLRACGSKRAARYSFLVLVRTCGPFGSARAVPVMGWVAARFRAGPIPALRSLWRWAVFAANDGGGACPSRLLWWWFARAALSGPPALCPLWARSPLAFGRVPYPPCARCGMGRFCGERWGRGFARPGCCGGGSHGRPFRVRPRCARYGLGCRSLSGGSHTHPGRSIVAAGTGRALRSFLSPPSGRFATFGGKCPQGTRFPPVPSLAVAVGRRRAGRGGALGCVGWVWALI